MARIERFRLPTLYVDAQRTDNGWLFIAWKPHTSMCFTDKKALAKWAWPAKTPTGSEFRSWLDSLDAPKEPVPSISQPEHGLDESDPQFQTRTII